MVDGRRYVRGVPPALELAVTIGIFLLGSAVLTFITTVAGLGGGLALARHLGLQGAPAIWIGVGTAAIAGSVVPVRYLSAWTWAHNVYTIEIEERVTVFLEDVTRTGRSIDRGADPAEVTPREIGVLVVFGLAVPVVSVGILTILDGTIYKIATVLAPIIGCVIVVELGIEPLRAPVDHICMSMGGIMATVAVFPGIYFYAYLYQTPIDPVESFLLLLPTALISSYCLLLLYDWLRAA